MSAPATPIKVRVQRKRTEAQGICSLELVPVQGALPPFTAGAHLDVHLPNGLVRQYSLCNSPAESNRYEIAVLRDANSRGGSTAVHDLVPEGAVIDISEPRNHFPLADGAAHHLLMGGGIGITPMMAMAETLSSQGAAFTLHYCTRSLERTAFVDRIAASPWAASVHHHFDDGAPGQKLDIVAALAAQTPGTHLYVCGPQPFIDAVLGSARAQGWTEDRLHVEFFGAAPTAKADDGGFEIEVAGTGKVIRVAKDQTALAALQAAGLDIPMSCEQGVCGTCLTRVIAGTPDHRDHYLTDEEKSANDQFLPCCSRAKTQRLVVEV